MIPDGVRDAQSVILDEVKDTQGVILNEVLDPGCGSLTGSKMHRVISDGVCDRA